VAGQPDSLQDVLLGLYYSAIMILSCLCISIKLFIKFETAVRGVVVRALESYAAASEF